MKILRLELDGYIKFQASNISNLNMTIEALRQIIIGTNGSGKSSLLKELFPSALIKSLFLKDGYEVLIIEHDEKKYELLFNPSLGHSFIVNGTNLNENGTYNLQKELIETHFGLNAAKQTILNCGFSLTRMTPSQRKSVLLDLNPVDISLFIEKHKAVRKQTLRHSTNLTMLMDRQKELVEKKLPEEEYKKLLAVREKLENQEKLLLIWITKAESLQSTFEDYRPDTSVNNLEEIRKDFLKHLRTLYGYVSVSSDDVDVQLVKLPLLIEKAKEDIQIVSNDIASIIAELEEVERAKASAVEVDENMSAKITELQKKASSYRFSEDFVPISTDRLGKLSDETIPILNELVNQLSHSVTDSIMELTDIDKLKERLAVSDMEFSSLTNQQARNSEQIQQLNKLIKDYSTPSDCPKDSCQLFGRYNTHQTKIISQVDELKRSDAEIDKKLPELSKSIEIDKGVLNSQRIIWIIIQKIITLIEEDMELLHIVKIDGLVNVLRSNPYGLINKASDYVQTSQEYHTRTSIQNTLSELLKQQELVKDRGKVSVEILDKEIAKRQESLKVKRCQYNQIETLLVEYQRQLDSMMSFKEELNHLVGLYDTIYVYEHSVIAEKNREYTAKVISIMDGMLRKTRVELVTIVGITKEQESLIERLEKEIDVQVNKTRTKFERCKEVESALFQLQLDYTRSFVNNVIESMNYFLGLIFTYPIEVEMFSSDRDLNFQFGIVVKDIVRIKDINECSDAQKDMIDLAFSLALILELKLHDYPLYVDELDRALDPVHKLKLLELLNALVDKEIVSQLFNVNHSTDLFDGFDGDTIVLDKSNVQLPTVYNEHVTIEYGR